MQVSDVGAGAQDSGRQRCLCRRQQGAGPEAEQPGPDHYSEFCLVSDHEDDGENTNQGGDGAGRSGRAALTQPP